MRERLFYLEPIKNSRGRMKGEKFGRISHGVLCLSRDYVEGKLKVKESGAVPASAFIAIFADISKRVIGFRLSSEGTLPLQKHERVVKIRGNGSMLVSIHGTTREMKVTKSTDRLDIKSYKDDVFGDVDYIVL